MFKEICISIIIVVVIFVLDYSTGIYTKKSTDDIIVKINQLENDIKENNELNVKNEIKDVNSSWKLAKEKLAYYIEHNELEKVETGLQELISYIDTGDNNLAICKIEKTKFILEHIKDKYEFSLENIF